MTSTTLAVAGRKGLERDLVSHVLQVAGFAQTNANDADVAVLVDPRPDQLESARDTHTGVVVITSAEPDSADFLDLVLRGADAVLQTKTPPAELERAVLTVAAGGCVFPSTHVRTIVDALRAEQHPSSSLTRREEQILRCIDAGHSVKQTARELGIAPKTVENLQSRLFRKLGARNRAQAVAEAHGRGLLADN